MKCKKIWLIRYGESENSGRVKNGYTISEKLGTATIFRKIIKSR